ASQRKVAGVAARLGDAGDVQFGAAKVVDRERVSRVAAHGDVAKVGVIRRRWRSAAVRNRLRITLQIDLGRGRALARIAGIGDGGDFCWRQDSRQKFDFVDKPVEPNDPATRILDGADAESCVRIGELRYVLRARLQWGIHLMLIEIDLQSMINGIKGRGYVTK